MEMNLAVGNPNLSIVLPGPCNGHCKFCFWKPQIFLIRPAYVRVVKDILKNLPEQFKQISITGGEPAISPYLEDVLKLIDKKKFLKVVLTTNGTNLMNKLNVISKKVNHINISRHHYDDSVVKEIYGTNTIPNEEELIALCSECNRLGMDVTFNCVITNNISPKNIRRFINHAKDCGASAVSFRKQHGNLEPTKHEKYYEGWKTTYSSCCPVCRTKGQFIDGMYVNWKCSSLEPSVELKGVYEGIIQTNGNFTADWEGKIILYGEKEEVDMGALDDAIKATEGLLDALTRMKADDKKKIKLGNHLADKKKTTKRKSYSTGYGSCGSGGGGFCGS